MRRNARFLWFSVWAASVLQLMSTPLQGDIHIHVVEADTNMVQEAFMGVGFRMSAHLDQATPRETAEVFAKRWQEMAPSHALAAHTWSWRWEQVVPFMKTVLNGSEIWLTTIEPSGATPEKLPDSAKVAGMLERLVKKEGVGNVSAYYLNTGRPGADTAGPTAEAARFCSELAERLKALDLKIKVVPGLPAGIVSPEDLKGISVSEPEAGLRLAEATMAAILAKAPAVTCMPFADLPSAMTGGGPSESGIFEYRKPDFKTRPPYYAAAILAKYTRGPARVYPATCAHPDVKCIFLRSANGRATALIVNRSDQALASQLHLTFMQFPGDLRQYVYRVGDVPTNPFGDIQPCEDHLVSAGKRVGFRIPLPPNSLSVVHGIPDKEPPEQIRFVDVSKAEGGGNLLKWDPVVDKDLCYYRIYSMNIPNFKFAKKTQIGSTTATHFVHAKPPENKKTYYAVIAVDRYGNHFQ